MVQIHHKQSGNVFFEVEADNLIGANLMGAYLIHADLSFQDMTSAHLVFCNLSGADLRGANLKNANLSGANLTETDLTQVDLTGANLSGATLSLTILHGCVGLHTVKGLDKIVHANPSEVDEATLSASITNIPDTFMRGAGFTWSEIGFYRSKFDSHDA